MGEHKYNPTAIAAKKGELPPKKKPINKMERKRIIYAEMYKRLGIAAVVSHTPPKGE